MSNDLITFPPLFFLKCTIIKWKLFAHSSQGIPKRKCLVEFIRYFLYSSRSVTCSNKQPWISVTKHNGDLFPSHLGCPLGGRGGSPESHWGSRAFQRWFHRAFSASCQRCYGKREAVWESGVRGPGSRPVGHNSSRGLTQLQRHGEKSSSCMSKRNISWFRELTALFLPTLQGRTFPNPANAYLL